MQHVASFFRKLSIGDKIKDGIVPPVRVMGTAEDLTKNQNVLTLKTDTELKESVYGKLPSICVLYRPIFFGYCPISTRWCDIANDL